MCSEKELKEFRWQRLKSIRSRIQRFERFLRIFIKAEENATEDMIRLGEICSQCRGYGTVEKYDERNDPYSDKCERCSGLGRKEEI